MFLGWPATKKEAHSHPLQKLLKRSKFIKQLCLYTALLFSLKIVNIIIVYGVNILTFVIYYLFFYFFYF